MDCSWGVKGRSSRMGRHFKAARASQGYFCDASFLEINWRGLDEFFDV